jgi:gliding motility-associated-like protein
VDGFEDLNLDSDNDPATDPTDTDNDGIPDYLDIDSDDDGLPDNVEAQSTAAYLAPLGIDMNGNGLDDAYEGGSMGLFPEDTDGDNLPDYLDEDSDNDGVPDHIEGHDHDRNGIPEASLIGSDKDNDGLDDGYEGATVIDMDVNDEIDDPQNDLPDTDGDGESDYRDIDDDGDGKITSDEDVNKDGDYTNDDIDGNGIPDYLEPNGSEPDLEVFNVVTPNGDGIHDVLSIRGLENYPNNTIKIYNRWGVLVYSTRGYNSQGNVFDGTSQGRVTIDQDNKLPVGTYFYILEFEDPGGTLKSINGYIYLNK